MKRIQVLALLGLLLSLTACKTFWSKSEDEDNNPYQGMSAKQLVTDAKQSIAKGQFETAAKRLEALESMYPFSNYAEQGQIDLIYAYYQKGDFPSAAATAERFIHLYPRAKHVDYAYYMKGLANFQQTRGALAGNLPIDEAWRDPGSQSQAYSDFSTFVDKFPSSRYRANALQRMIYLRNTFAKRELHTAQYYYERKMYVAAVERANYLIENYPQAPSAKEALAILYSANKILGLNKASEDALAVYRATYKSLPPLQVS